MAILNCCCLDIADGWLLMGIEGQKERAYDVIFLYYT
jgi:hypothetical protein